MNRKLVDMSQRGEERDRDVRDQRKGKRQTRVFLGKRPVYFVVVISNTGIKTTNDIRYTYRRRNLCGSRGQLSLVFPLVKL